MSYDMARAYRRGFKAGLEAAAVQHEKAAASVNLRDPGPYEDGAIIQAMMVKMHRLEAAAIRRIPVQDERESTAQPKVRNVA